MMKPLVSRCNRILKIGVKLLIFFIAQSGSVCCNSAHNTGKLLMIALDGEMLNMDIEEHEQKFDLACLAPLHNLHGFEGPSLIRLSVCKLVEEHVTNRQGGNVLSIFPRFPAIFYPHFYHFGKMHIFPHFPAFLQVFFWILSPKNFASHFRV